VSESYGQLPLQFEANHGQTDEQVKFLARGSGYTLFLTATEAVLRLRMGEQESQDEQPPDFSGQSGLLPRADLRSAIRHSQSAVLRMQLAGAASAEPQMVGLEELPGRVNYFIGHDPTEWRTDISTYARVHYREVYPGVSLVYYGNQGELEYDFILAPGADPNAIALDFAGADQIAVDDEGNLVLRLAGGQVRQRRPVIYQEVNGVRQEVSGAYVLTGEHRVGFQVGDYDARKPLVIDPVLVYSTYLGGSGGEFASGMAVDPTGSAYLTGFTTSTDFPTANPARGTPGGGSCGNGPCPDAFVAKLNLEGNALVYATYLGGNNIELGGSLAVDSAGQAYVIGLTGSSNFPTVNPAQGTFGGGACGNSPCADAFVAKLNPAGNDLVYSTYLGGNGVELFPVLGIDEAGNAYLTGLTASTNFPIANAVQRTIGGNNCSPNSCADVFVTRLNTNAAGAASLVYSTYLGGDGPEVNNKLAVDSTGNVYLTGTTSSTNFPTSGNAFQGSLRSGGNCGNEPCSDAFVTRLNTNASGAASLLYSTYIGGSHQEFVQGMAVDSAGNVYVAGITISTNFPTRNAFQPDFAGGTCSNNETCNDAFVTKLDTNGAGAASLLYSTYLGGRLGASDPEELAGTDAAAGLNGNQLAASSSSPAEGVQGIAVDATGNAHVFGITGAVDFPVKNAAQPNFGGGVDAFVTKLDTNAVGAASLSYSTYLGGSDVENLETTIFSLIGLIGDDGLAVDSAGNIYVTGTTHSSNFTTVNPVRRDFGGGTCDGEPCPDVYVVKLNPNAIGLTSVVYATYLGGNSGELPSGLAIDAAGNAYVAGFTGSTNFPTANPRQRNLVGGTDVFIAKIGESASNGADLALAKSHTDPFNSNSNGVYSLKVTNIGSAATTGTITVTDNLPAGLSFVSGTGQGWSCTASGQTVTCTNPGPLAAGASSSFNLTVGITPAALGSVTNTATVSNASDTNPANNTANDPTTIVTVAAAPVIASISPTSATAGGPAFKLTVNGANFARSPTEQAKVRWNGLDRPTRYISDKQLEADITAADIASPGTATITVVNPPLLGGTSNAVSFTINPAPTSNRVVRLVNASGGRGSTVNVPIELVAQGGENTVSFTLNYDPAVLSNPRFALGSGALPNSTFITNPLDSQTAQGQVGLIFQSPAGQSFAAGTRQILLLTFNIAASASASSTALEFGDQIIRRRVVSADAAVLEASFLSGTVTIISNGFEADVLPQPNGDGDVFPEDVVRIARLALKLNNPQSSGEFQRADCAPRANKGDGFIDSVDVVQAARYALSIDQKVAAGGPTSPSTEALTLGLWHSTATVPNEANSRVVQIVNASGAPGSTVSMPIELVAQGGENTVSFTLNYDPAVLSNPRFALGSGALPNSTFITNPLDSQTAQGQVGLIFQSPAGQSFAAGTRQILLLTLNIAASASAGSTALEFGDQIIRRRVVSVDAAVLEAAFMNGAVTINEPGNPTPMLNTLNPNSATAGGSDFTLTVMGANFINGSRVRWNNIAQTTTFVSSTQLTAQIPADHIAAAGTASVTVFNPAPGGGTSNALSFTINSAANPVVNVSAASYKRDEPLAPDSIVSAFGSSLATTTHGEAATTLPLPTTLAGTRVSVKDSAGVERLAPLFYVRADQVNYLLLENTAMGAARVTVTSGDGRVSMGTAQIAAVAPGLFAANANAQGVAAGLALRVRNGVQSLELIAQWDAAQGRMVPLQLDLGPATDEVYLILYGTGFRYASSLAAVTARIGGSEAQVLYAGPTPGFIGLDQLNLRIPRSLAGCQLRDIVLTVDGRSANVVQVGIKNGACAGG
jgi:uncharacterized protein (TIGR03437 family)